MGTDDSREKIKQAWEWLKTEPFESEHYNAAHSHLWNVLPDDELSELVELDVARYQQDSRGE